MEDLVRFHKITYHCLYDHTGFILSPYDNFNIYKMIYTSTSIFTYSFIRKFIMMQPKQVRSTPVKPNAL